MIGALSAMSILTIAGFAIDMRHTTNRKADLRAVVDSGVLAAAKGLQDGDEKDQCHGLLKPN